MTSSSVTRRTRSRRRGRPGFVLLAVLVVVAAAILVATGAIFTARGTTAGARASSSDARLREAALDGVALVADRIAGQRAAILRGGAPEVEPVVLARGEGLDAVEVVLAPLGGGVHLASEGAKLDANAVDRATLARMTDGLGSDAVEVAEALARIRPLASLDGAAASLPESARLRGLRALLGPLRAVEVEADRAPEDDEPCLADLLGVHAREALVANDGAPRLDVVAALGSSAPTASDSDAAPPAAALARFDDGELEALRQAVDELAKSGDAGAPDDGRLATALLARGIGPDRIAEILAETTLAPGSLAPARLDLVRADRRALAAFDGIGAEAADRIVELRTTLEPAEREGTSWLVARRVLEPDAYARIAGRISHRSTAWRFRVVARHAGDGASSGDGGGMDGRSATGGPLAAFDCIVDVSGETPRLVFLRDVGMLPTARALALALAERAADRGSANADGDARSAGASDDGAFRSASFDDAAMDGASIDDASFEEASFDEAVADEMRPARVKEFRPNINPRSGSAVDSNAGSATMPALPRAPSRARTDPTGRDVGSGGGTRR